MSEDAKGYVETARDISSVLGAIKSVVKDAKEKQGRVYFNSDVPYTPSQEDAFTEMDVIYIDKVSKYNIGLAEILEQNTDVARIPRAVWSDLDNKLQKAENAAKRTRSAGIQKAQAVAQYALGVQRLKKIADKIKDEPEPKAVSEQLYEITHSVCKWFQKKDGMHHNKTSAKLLAGALEAAVLPDKPIPVYVISREDLRLPASVTYRLCIAQNAGGRYNGNRDSIVTKLERANIVVLRYNVTAANFLPAFENKTIQKREWDFDHIDSKKHKAEILKLLDEQLVKINKVLLGESYIPPNHAIKTDSTPVEKVETQAGDLEEMAEAETGRKIEVTDATGQNVAPPSDAPAPRETIETKKDDSLAEAYKKIGELESKLSGIEARMGEQDKKYEALLAEVNKLKEKDPLADFVEEDGTPKEGSLLARWLEAGRKPNSELDESKSFLEKVLSAAQTVAGAETETTPTVQKPAEVSVPLITQPGKSKILREAPQARPVEEWDADARLVYQRMVSMGAEINDGTISFATNVFYSNAAEILGLSESGAALRLKKLADEFGDGVKWEKGKHSRAPGKVTMPLGLFSTLLANHRRKD